MFDSLFDEIVDITQRDKKDTTQTYVKLGEEHGELAKELLAYLNTPSTLHRFSTRESVVEECIDVALVAISLAIKAGANRPEIEKMFRSKMDKWATILQNEGRLKDITNIPFEIHITCDVDKMKKSEFVQKFKLGCLEAGVKPISLLLINSNGEQLEDNMTSSKFFGTNSEAIAESERIANIMKSYVGVVRSKIETVPWHPLAPQTEGQHMPDGCYFESHVAIIIPSNITADDLWKLKSLCIQHSAHFSQNVIKSNQDGYVQMATIREYKDRVSFDKRVNDFVECLAAHGFEHERVISEFSLFDTNVHHDKSWLT